MKKIIVTVLLTVFATLSLLASGQKDTVVTQDGSLPKVEMKIGDIENPNNLGALAIDRFAEIMKEKSGGKFIITAFHASQLGDAMKQLDQVKSGTIQSFRGSISWLQCYNPDVAIVEFPYLATSVDEAESIFKSPALLAVNNNLREKHGIEWVTASWTRLPRHILSNKLIEKPEDLDGVKIRVPDSKTYIECFKAMGASPTIVSFNETYLALQQGIVDGAENHILSLYNMKWFEQGKHVALTGHAYDTPGFIVNSKWWSSLPQEYKEMFIETDAEVNEWYKSQLETVAEDYMKKMEESGISFHEVDQNAFASLCVPNVALEIEKEGYWSEGLFEEIYNYLNK